MGYTHYWEGEAPIAKALPIIEKIVAQGARQGIPLAGWDGEGEPVITAEEIRFNGVGDDAHETFAIVAGETGFAFCKTARKPYDAIVVAILIALSEVEGPSTFSWSSDGDGEPGAFDAARLLLMEVGLTLA